PLCRSVNSMRPRSRPTSTAPRPLASQRRGSPATSLYPSPAAPKTSLHPWPRRRAPPTPRPRPLNHLASRPLLAPSSLQGPASTKEEREVVSATVRRACFQRICVGRMLFPISLLLILQVTGPAWSASFPEGAAGSESVTPTATTPGRSATGA